MGQICRRRAASTTDAKWPWACRLAEEIDRRRPQPLQSKKERRLRYRDPEHPVLVWSGP